jgi:hypothetical protein
LDPISPQFLKTLLTSPEQASSSDPLDDGLLSVAGDDDGQDDLTEKGIELGALRYSPSTQ